MRHHNRVKNRFRARVYFLVFSVVCGLAVSFDYDVEAYAHDVAFDELLPKGTQIQIYSFAGAVDRGDGNLATTVHCTNVGSVAATITVEIWNSAGNQLTAGNLALGVTETKTVSTRNTSAYSEDSILSPALVIEQGHGRVLADTAGSTDVLCAAQVLDPSNVTPISVTTLSLFDRFGVPVSELGVFLDGFESGDTTAWTNSVGSS